MGLRLFQVFPFTSLGGMSEAPNFAMPKKRLDLLLVEKGLASSRERAQRLILAGQVIVNDQPNLKAGQLLPEDAVIRLREPDHPYVSRGALKLKAAIETFQIPTKGRVGMDVGASTGGFTEILLQGDVEKVYAIDVGHNQMDWKIRSNPKVVVHEKVNARSLPFDLVGQTVDLIVVDVSFISLDKILPSLVPFSHPQTDWVTLIKPQFEVGREKVGKGGIVTQEADRFEAVERITNFAKTLGLNRLGLIESPIQGTEGNHEYLAHWRRSTSE
jgi:23S rRNA (cytidine1920-2'-O)/16S rRNA (cytidine1409-2'-O)-methyltransferase